MSNLLTAEDIEHKVFKKVSFGGYAVSEVEEFLGQIIEDMKAYAIRIGEQKSRILELEESMKKYESMEEAIKDTLIMAQKVAQEKQEEAERRAASFLAETEAKRNEIDDRVRSRIDEANKEGEGIIAAARLSAAQITQDAKRMRDETERRFENLDKEIEHRLAEANDHVGQITANARLEARRMLGKARSEIDENERVLSVLRSEKERFLREFGDLLSKCGNFLKTIQEGPANEAAADSSPENPQRKSATEAGEKNREREEHREREESGEIREGGKGENSLSSPMDLFETNEETKNEEMKDEVVIF